MNIKFKTGVRYNGNRYGIGQIESKLSEEDASFLVKKDVAFVVGVPDSEKLPQINNEPGEKDNDEVNDSDIEQVYKEIDDNWTVEELKEDAKPLGIDFGKLSLKKDLINFIIESGRAKDFLSMLEDPEE